MSSAPTATAPPATTTGFEEDLRSYFTGEGFNVGFGGMTGETEPGSVALVFGGAPLLVMALPVLLMGSAYPFVQALVSERVETLGRRTGFLVFSNIAGNVAGTLLVSFVLLDRVGLTERLDFRPDQLSGGEKQRVAIARALANNPTVLLADEPTANLDSGHGREIARLLRRLAEEAGRSIVIVSHDARLREVADRILWLEDGTFRELASRPSIASGAPKMSPTNRE